ncbi:DNA-binding transcriptional LysR family regulator [Sphingomonas naasensis]|uniref:LysR family transcriptional regulator n=1 Tax=Sphingomonas naasensis TaxID=1344951 RepID=A0A4S1WCL7_9SPHN|nr:LysR family transcriptional regulator [Sphingomonas naasensis]NIJ19534.1 DNA-binding transcriptional LysR family regulator [Sphingomonas naasensis]TGX39267.1 LysR family transcriptional regulator [Sphingomonas naasensis]
MKLPDFEAWAIFAAVVEHRSFSAAAEALAVSKATVSKAISRLETRLGTSLFHRTSRRLTLTDSGRALADHAQRILSEGEAAEEAAFESASAPVGLVRLAAPLTFGIQAVAPALADFMALHPGIKVDLRLSDAFVDIVGEGIDIALRIAELPDSSLRARRLGPVTGHIVAAPAYWDRAGRPRHPADLATHACFVYTNTATPDVWRFRRAGGEEAAVRIDGPIRTDNGDAMLPALRAGLGVARLPDFLVAQDLAAGRLEAVLADWAAGASGLHLLTPPGTLRPARVEALIDFLSDRLRKICGEAHL